MNRVLGLDIGERRIGFAFGNVLSVGSSMVVPGGFLLVENEAQALKQVKELIEEEGPDTLVIGVPLVDGAESRQSEKIRKFAAQIRAQFPELPMHFWDESLTSYSAGKALVSAELKHSGQAKKGRVDALAASLIVQSFLDARRGYAAGF